MRRFTPAAGAVALALLGTALIALGPAEAARNQAPTLGAATMSRTAANVTVEDRRLVVRVRVLDDHGIGQVMVRLVDDEDNTALNLALIAQRVAGTARDGWYVARSFVPHGFRAGTFRLSVEGIDREGESTERVYENHTLVVVDHDEDTQAPTVRLVGPSRDATYDVRTRRAIVPVRLRVRDDKSGVDVVLVCLGHPRPTVFANLPCWEARRTSGTRLDGIWALRYAIPRGAPGGYWNVEVWLTDHAHRDDTTYWQGPDRAAVSRAFFPFEGSSDRPLPAGRGRFAVIGAGDQRLPRLTEVEVSPTSLTAGVGGAITVTALGRDLRGIRRIDVVMFEDADAPTLAWSGRLRLVGGTITDGTWRRRLIVGGDVSAGSYLIQLIVWDRNNVRVYLESPPPGDPVLLPVPGPSRIEIS